MGFDIVSSRNQFPVARLWWGILADYSRHTAPSVAEKCRYWYSNDGDGLNAAQARQLGGELQRSVDDCRIDAYARQYFALMRTEPDCALQHNVFVSDCRDLPTHEQERRFVDEFVSEVQRFIEFLLACDGFAIL
jgi:hypothetical protein